MKLIINIYKITLVYLDLKTTKHTQKTHTHTYILVYIYK